MEKRNIKLKYTIIVKSLIISIIFIGFMYEGMYGYRRFSLSKCETLNEITTESLVYPAVVDHTIFSRIYRIFLQHSISSKEIYVIENYIKQNYEISRVSDDAPNIILVIGESHNKHQTFLYGSSYNTNPHLSKLNKNNLIIFSDVISPTNSTYEAMRYIFSFSSPDNNIWPQTPLFPRLFKKSGYYTSFISNQEIPNIIEEDQYTYAASYYLTSQKTIDSLFCFYNNKRCQYDGDLIEHYKNNIYKKGEKNLSIIHLYGQHISYSDRYPKCFKTLKSDDIARNDLNEYQKNELSDYLNATAYNDYVINKIIENISDEDVILIYFSDHGEEVYDYRDHRGRTLSKELNKNICKYQYEVPFIIWMSDKYKEKRGYMADKIIASKERPFITSNIPHLLFDISGIKCDWFDPTKSVVNDNYDLMAKRILSNGDDYDYIIKD